MVLFYTIFQLKTNNLKKINLHLTFFFDAFIINIMKKKRKVKIGIDSTFYI
jgi:hypothetical protein